MNESLYYNLTEMIWYELDIMAISMLSSTMMLMTEYEPNMSRAQNRVKLLIPVRSKDIRSTMPKLAQNNDCDVSKRLKAEINSVVKRRLDCSWIK